MVKIVEGSLRAGLRSTKAIIKSSPTIRSLLGDIESAESYSDISQHELMLADKVRNDAYYEAIARYVRPEHVVADLGTGTGILAILAAQQGSRKVYAIDHSSFIEIAKQIARHIGADSIRFVECNSRNFEPDEPLDVILHEQMGDGLIDENMVENLLDLKQRALKPTGLIIPGKFELYLEPISLDTQRQMKIPKLWEFNVHGIDFSFLKGSESLSPFRHHNYNRRLLHRGFSNFLCDPEPILSFDLNKMRSPGELPTVLEGTRKVVRSGSLDGICLHFRAIFQDDIVIDTSPVRPLTHWANPLFRPQSRMCAEGDTLHYRFEISDPIDARNWKITID